MAKPYTRIAAVQLGCNSSRGTAGPSTPPDSGPNEPFSLQSVEVSTIAPAYRSRSARSSTTSG
jgi:hypothetical protein